MHKGKTITLNDVANDSGVSYQTVSRVINDSPHVASQTRAQVLASIQKLGYRPNSAARRLVTGKSNTVGIISYETHQYGPAQMLLSMERALRQNHYGFVLASVDELKLNDIEQALNELERHAVDGIILITPLVSLEGKEVKMLVKHKPCLMIDAAYNDILPSVLIDQTDGSRQAIEHLLSLGHTRIAEISGPLSWRDALVRHQTWSSFIQAKGLERLSLEGNWTAQSGHVSAGKLLDKHVPFTALIVGNDQMALGAMRALQEAGLRVPEDVSVIGFDDVPEAAYFSPPLTTIRQDFERLGEQSIRLMLELIEDPEMSPKHYLLKPELVVRSSTGACKK
jgi:DNA-binding LacI/PurR family transcriptional regulator